MEIANRRKLVIQAIIVLIVLVFIARLFYIQLIDDKYKDLANDNVVRKKDVYPPRGFIYDRNGALMVGNAPMYDLMVVPYLVKELDTIKFCNLIGIEKKEFIDKLEKASKYTRYTSKYKPSVFIKQIPKETYSNLQEYLHAFPGFYARIRTVRYYLSKNAAHILGYIGEVNQQQIDSSDTYRLGDFIGVTGIELAYENDLRGQRGVKHVLVDVHNREQGNFNDGALDVDAIAGNHLTSTLNVQLQEYGEKLMLNKIGSIVAIEPSSGEILAILSSPTYDPNDFVGRNRGIAFKALSMDSLKPLFNRATMGTYSPGSSFKLVMALIGLQEGVVSPNYGVVCNQGYFFSGTSVRCHNHLPASNISKAVQYSCNAYFCKLFRRVFEQKKFENSDASLSKWGEYLGEFGLGNKLLTDVAEEVKGVVPTSDYYNKLYGKNRWYSTTIISLAIGQGELDMTPIQMANVMAIIANRGYYYSPHLVKSIYKGDLKPGIIETELHVTSIDKKHFNPVVNGMEQAVAHGTARLAIIKGITVCGKTGTVENSQGEDHSVFTAFAPKENPKIAIAVIVENAGWGGSWAAPIASLMIEKYLTDSISTSKLWQEERILDANFIQ
ncbi:MAG: penicillin-binding protein 2 [Bacteroidetes bacterium]|nr:penicillin-binding protein 2 [Bacteroidota bacterium]